MEQFSYNTSFKNQKILVQLNQFDKKIIQKYCATIKPSNCYVEIGTSEGGSALVARGATKADIYTIDINNYHPDIPDINFITKPSVEVAETWNKPIGVLFIDGNHQDAKKDFLAWEKHIVKGGYILFHDYIIEGGFTVVEDCDELFVDNPNYELIYRPLGRNNTRIFIVRKND